MWVYTHTPVWFMLPSGMCFIMACDKYYFALNFLPRVSNDNWICYGLRLLYKPIFSGYFTGTDEIMSVPSASEATLRDMGTLITWIS